MKILKHVLINGGLTLMITVSIIKPVKYPEFAGLMAASAVIAAYSNGRWSKESDAKQDDED